MTKPWITLLFLCAGLCSAQDIQPIARKLPPVGIEIPEDARAALEKEFQALGETTCSDPDILVYIKAVDSALVHNEFYKKGDEKVAMQLLARARERLEQKNAPWRTAKGLVVRGYRSDIDGSIQPYGLEIPEGLDLSQPVPLYVWLHGRGDKTTDLYFIRDRESKAGKLKVDDGIVVHPFGRHCMGFKSAGEIDVLDVIDEVRKQYPVDANRIVLAGFSMGGAGAWHVGTHYTDRFAAVHAGAGFAETARYTQLKPEDFPPAYEQTLWRIYDVPNYVRNLFNVPVVAYSGEVDKQIQAARVMEEAFKAEGRSLTHIIGPGMGHKYHPDSLAEVQSRLRKALELADQDVGQVFLQTQSLRYNRMDWVEVLRLDKHWEDTRVDAQFEGNALSVSTRNVRAFRLHRPAATIQIDGQSLDNPEAKEFWNVDGAWTAKSPEEFGLVKKPGLQGPIDDAFLEPFMVVTPSGTSQNARFQSWMAFELEHFLARWNALYRGSPRVKKDSEVTPEDLKAYHLIVWGDAESNALLARMAGALPFQPVKQDEVVVFTYPNPLNPEKYVVVNSGPTHREGHDHTNSLQNPKLGDWAIVDVRQAPDAFTPGKIVDAGFFDEAWQLPSK
ncbi:MAG: putative esterase [Verrucomicrobiales bacterium]|jgi:predicted esterase